MIRLENHLGSIDITESYFSTLICSAASSCFGVAGMANTNRCQQIRGFVKKSRNFSDQGVAVRKEGDGLNVDLHIIVTYGLNIEAIVRSIVNKVKYTVEEATGLEVKMVNVYVDGMKPQN